MNVCIPLEEPLENISNIKQAKLAQHFGKAKSFAIIDTDSGEIIGECGTLKNCPGPCKCPLPNIELDSVDALAGSSMGYRLVQMARRASVPAYLIKAETVGEFNEKTPELLEIKRVVRAGICCTKNPYL